MTYDHLGYQKGLTALEPRIMYDGAAVAAVGDVVEDGSQADDLVGTDQDDMDASVDETPDQPTEGSNLEGAAAGDVVRALEETSCRELVFVDPVVKDYQTLIEGVSSEARVIVLDPGRDGIEQISESLSAYQDLDAIHLVSHGNEGRIVMSGTELSMETIDAYGDTLTEWGNRLSEDADILLYGCDVAKSETGSALVSQIAELTGADVAASTDDTGASALGGDWDLEAEQGEIEAATLAATDYAHVLGTPSVSNLDNQTYTEGDGAIVIDSDVSLSDGTSYSGGYLEFELTNGQSEDDLGLVTDGSASTVDGELSIVDGTVYLGDGTNAAVVGSVDSTYDGQDGQKLRINFSNEFENGNFDDGTAGSSDINGWTVVNEQVKFGTDTIAGLATPTDTVWPTNKPDDNYTDQNTPTNLGTLQTVLSSTQNDGSGLSVQLSSSGMTTQEGYDIVRGPYIYSNGTVSLSAGDEVSFEWQAQGGGDAYDVYGYIVDVDSGHIETILNETGSSTSASTTWATETVTVSQAGQYRFVFVSGTYDYSGGMAAGAQLYIDDVSVTQAVAPATVNDTHATEIARRVTYENTGGDTPDTTTRNYQITANSADGNTGTGSSEISIVAVNDAPSLDTNSTLTVSEGGTATITNSYLNEGDPDDSGAGLTYTVTDLPSHGALKRDGTALTAGDTFTQDDIDNNLITYTHDGSEESADSFDFSLADGGEDGASATTGTFTFDLDPGNDAPTVGTNAELTVSEGRTATITNAYLNEADPDDSGAGLTYTLDSLPANGTLKKDGTALGIGDTFTQADIDNGFITYTHSGPATGADSFQFTLADGGEDGASAATGTFAVNVNAQNINIYQQNPESGDPDTPPPSEPTTPEPTFQSETGEAPQDVLTGDESDASGGEPETGFGATGSGDTGTGTDLGADWTGGEVGGDGAAAQNPAQGGETPGGTHEKIQVLPDGRVVFGEADTSVSEGLAVESVAYDQGSLEVQLAEIGFDSGESGYTATMADGAPLPSWLRVDPASGTIRATPPAGVTHVTVTVMTTDLTGQVRMIDVTLDLEEDDASQGEVDGFDSAGDVEILTPSSVLFADQLDGVTGYGTRLADALTAGG